MPRLAATSIPLTTKEQTALEKIARRPSTAQQIALRATIVLRAAQGASHGAIARELGITKDTSRLWRNRWLALSARELPIEDRLQDAPRPGYPPTFKVELEDIRHRTQTLIASLNVTTGQIDQASVGDTRTEADLDTHLSVLLGPAPTAPKIHLVMDCLNTHQSEALVRLVAELEPEPIELGEKGKSGILASMAMCLPSPPRLAKSNSV